MEKVVRHARISARELLATGFLNTLIGSIEGDPQFAEMSMDGLTNTVIAFPKREAAFRFLLAGVSIFLTGLLVLGGDSLYKLDWRMAMAPISVSCKRVMAAPSAAVYTCIADCQHHHAHFLPPAFKSYRVERGGYGAGTVVSFVTTGLTKPQAFRAVIEEPEPGRVLIERDMLSAFATTWTLSPVGVKCEVVVSTDFSTKSGLAGVIERLALPLLMRAVYADELKRLERYVLRQIETGALNNHSREN